MKQNQTDISVIIPVFNEENNIDLLYSRIIEVCKKIAISYELIFVNDGSYDNSLELIKRIAGTDKNVKFIDFSRNFGHQIAITAGMDKASGKYIVFIDADLQDPPELIENLFLKTQEVLMLFIQSEKAEKENLFLKKLQQKHTIAF
jgi:dolichol-phosphate mannosyltransferase